MNLDDAVSKSFFKTAHLSKLSPLEMRDTKFPKCEKKLKILKSLVECACTYGWAISRNIFIVYNLATK